MDEKEFERKIQILIKTITDINNEHNKALREVQQERNALKKQLNNLNVRNASENPENKQNNEHKTEKDVCKAIDKALELLKQKRENAKLDLEKTSKKYYNLSSDTDRQVVIDVGTEMETLRASIDTYTDSISTIEAELGRKGSKIEP